MLCILAFEFFLMNPIGTCTENNEPDEKAKSPS